MPAATVATVRISRRARLSAYAHRHRRRALYFGTLLLAAPTYIAARVALPRLAPLAAEAARTWFDPHAVLLLSMHVVVVLGAIAIFYVLFDRFITRVVDLIFRARYALGFHDALQRGCPGCARAAGTACVTHPNVDVHVARIRPCYGGTYGHPEEE